MLLDGGSQQACESAIPYKAAFKRTTSRLTLRKWKRANWRGEALDRNRPAAPLSVLTVTAQAWVFVGCRCMKLSGVAKFGANSKAKLRPPAPPSLRKSQSSGKIGTGWRPLAQVSQLSAKELNRRPPAVLDHSETILTQQTPCRRCF